MDPKDIVKKYDGSYSCLQCGGMGVTSESIKHNCPKCKYCGRPKWNSKYDGALIQQQQNQRQASFRK